MRVYIIVAVFGNTKENHAGMYYLAKKLKEESRNKISVISTPTKYAGVLSPVYRLLNIIIGLYLRLKVKKDDCVLLMEYLSPRQEQSVIADNFSYDLSIFPIDITFIRLVDNKNCLEE